MHVFLALKDCSLLNVMSAYQNSKMVLNLKDELNLRIVHSFSKSKNGSNQAILTEAQKLAIDIF